MNLSAAINFIYLIPYRLLGLWPTPKPIRALNPNRSSEARLAIFRKILGLIALEDCFNA